MAINHDQVSEFRKALTANSSDTSFASIVPTRTEPVGATVFDVIANAMGAGVMSPQWAMIMPYGLGSDNDVFDLRIWRWNFIGQGLTRLWVPHLIAPKFTCTISTFVGAASSEVLNTERFADTITNADTAITSVTDPVRITSPTGDLPAHIAFRLYGARRLQFVFDPTTGTPTMNCLISMF